MTSFDDFSNFRTGRPDFNVNVPCGILHCSPLRLVQRLRRTFTVSLNCRAPRRCRRLAPALPRSQLVRRRCLALRFLTRGSNDRNPRAIWSRALRTRCLTAGLFPLPYLDLLVPCCRTVHPQPAGGLSGIPLLVNLEPTTTPRSLQRIWLGLTHCSVPS